LAALQLRKLWRYGVETQHLHPLKSSLLVLACEGKYFGPFFPIRVKPSNHDDDLALVVTVAGGNVALLNWWQEKPATGAVHLAHQYVSARTVAWGVVA
jgi:hypothetical protein